MIERFHRSLKSSLQARLVGSNWVAHLPLVMLGLRSLLKEDSGFFPAEAVYGSNLSLSQASSSNILRFLQKVFSARLNLQFKVSQDLHDIT